MKFVRIFSVFLSLPLLGSSFTLQLFDRDSERLEETIGAILEIQQSLLLPLDVSEIPPSAQNGFLTIHSAREYLLDFLETGRFLIAYHQDQIVGYLLLDQVDGYLQWARGKQFQSDWDLYSLPKIQYIDQIAVVSSFARQGIGTLLVDYAKKVSPQGLLTDILTAPYSNQASKKFFITRGFVELGTMQVEETVTYPKHATSVMLWLPDLG